MKRLNIAALSLSLLLVACGAKGISISKADGSGSMKIDVEIADTPSERAEGLMERTSLPEEGGMLFVFPVPQPLSFWMKNTKIPLEIIFFDHEGGFVNALTMQPCTADPCPTYKAAALSQFALEVNPGFREKHGIGVGSKLDLVSVSKIARPE